MLCRTFDRALAAALVAAVFSSAAAADEAPAYPLAASQARAWTAEATRAALLQALNAERARHALPPLQRERLLERAAQQHADYLALHQRASHEQQAGLAGFSGVRPFERVRAAGFPLPLPQQLAEVYVVGQNDVAEVLAQLLGGPYHRHALLRADARWLGVGLSAQPGVVLGLVSQAGAPDSAPAWLLSPRPGEQGVRPLVCCERPRPAGLDVFGQPISVQGPEGERLQVQQFRLLDAEGQAVPTQLLQADTDAHLRRAPHVAYLLPLQPLRAAQRYTVQLQASSAGQTLNQQWQFDTR